ncbi:hypothetical protein AVEN_216233-1 [Araneus ventricosus]|uniref:Uncharacterized protein n=1 Tax=Araneus ventricosus TaxID=182803 RepID=A0A4Y2PC50_ARAVE|nr:hypothetical protein AVEN_216233-1 [Araneus ventricosus]
MAQLLDSIKDVHADNEQNRCKATERTWVKVSNKKQFKPELLEQDLHPTFSPLHSAQQITKAKPVEFIFTPILFFPTISFAENHRDSKSKAINTDGSETDEGTGNTHYILENYEIIASRQANLSAYLAERFNPCHGNLCDNPLPLLTTRFPKPFRQAFFAIWVTIKMAIETASSLHRPIKISTDSLSSLMAILNPKSHHSVVRELQTLLFSHKRIHLRWIKAYVVYLGNECADQLAKEAITKSDLLFLPKPLSYLKSEIKSAALSTWQNNWDSEETGRSTHDIVSRVSYKPVGWKREELIFVTGHGPFPPYLQSSHTWQLLVRRKRRSNALCHKMSVYPLPAFPNTYNDT